MNRVLFEALPERLVDTLLRHQAARPDLRDRLRRHWAAGLVKTAAAPLLSHALTARLRAADPSCHQPTCTCVRCRHGLHPSPTIQPGMTPPAFDQGIRKATVWVTAGLTRDTAPGLALANLSRPRWPRPDPEAHPLAVNPKDANVWMAGDGDREHGCGRVPDGRCRRAQEIIHILETVGVARGAESA